MHKLLLTLLAVAGLGLGMLAPPAAAGERGVFYATPGYHGGPSARSFDYEPRRVPTHRRRGYDGGRGYHDFEDRFVYRHRPVHPRTVYRYRYPRDTYPPFYGRRHDPGAAVAAGIIGLATGAIIGQALTAPPVRTDAEAIAYCARRYRSFDPHSFTFLGYDGRRHYCRVP